MPRPRIDPGKIEIITNPGDPDFGEFWDVVYNNFHPVYGRDTKALMKKLRGWNGDMIRFGVFGTRTDWERGGRKRKFKEWRFLVLTHYRDLFGPSGIYLEICKDQLAKKSLPELSVSKILIAKE